MDDNKWEAEKRAFAKAIEAFQYVLAQELGGNNDASVRHLADSVHIHNTLLLFGDPPLWKKEAISVTISIEFGSIITASQLNELMKKY